MSIEAMVAVMNAQIPGEPSVKGILLVLANYADRTGRRVFPTLRTVASISQHSYKTVQRVVETLESHKILIEVLPPRQHRPARYRIDLAKLDILPRAVPPEAEYDDESEDFQTGHGDHSEKSRPVTVSVQTGHGVPQTGHGVLQTGHGDHQSVSTPHVTVSDPPAPYPQPEARAIQVQDRRGRPVGGDPARILLAAYQAGFRGMNGDELDPAVDAKLITKCLRPIWQTHGLERTLALLEQFFAADASEAHWWVRKHCWHEPNAFAKAVKTLISEAVATTPAPMTTTGSKVMDANLTAAARVIARLRAAEGRPALTEGDHAPA